MNAKKIWDSYKFPLLLLGGIFIGAVLGMVLGEKATVLAPLGDIFLNLIRLGKNPGKSGLYLYRNRRICCGPGSCGRKHLAPGSQHGNCHGFVGNG